MKWTPCLFIMLFFVVFQRISFAAPAVANLPENRILLFDDYVLTNNAPTPTWVHVGPITVGLNYMKALLAGTNHFHRTGWFLRACRTGCSGYMPNARIIPPRIPALAPIYPVTASNLAANLQNDLSARIESPVFTNGIGTVYFEAINSLQDYPTQISVDIATNMYSSNLGMTLYTVNPPSTNGYDLTWETLDQLTLNAATSNDFTRYSRMLNYRGSAKIRIRRMDYQAGLPADSTFTVIDNIRVSVPPLDVTVAKTDFPFEPGYPSVGTNITVRCYVSNADTNAPTDTRALRVIYRWRYLNQVIGAWRTNAMSYVTGTGDGAGNGERYAAVLPPFTDAGDLEYYFICDFTGYLYQSPDYTGMGYSYPAESVTTRTLRGSGTEYSVRLRPYRSRYGALYAETDQHSEPIAMALTGDNEWRAMAPVALPSVTNLTWRFKGSGEYVVGAEAASTGVTYWAGQGAVPGGSVPYGGACVPTNRAGRLSVRIDSGTYAMLTLNTDKLQYMANRAEYQNFNFWPAPLSTYTESNGQVERLHFLNTFDSWPTNAAETYQEPFIGTVSQTNAYSLSPFSTPGNWTACNAKFVTERTFDSNPLAYNNARNTALRLRGDDTGLGLGCVNNTAMTLPDGLKTVTFKSRLEQTSSNNDIVYKRDDFTKTNYLVRAAVNASGNSMSPETPSLSLIAYYRDPGNFYEFKITQVANPAGTAANPQDVRANYRLYKWVNGTATLLAESSTNLIMSPLSLGQAEMRLYNTSESATQIQCKLAFYDNVLNYTDDASPFQFGTYGFVSADCKARFTDVEVGATTSGDVQSGAVTTTLGGFDTFDTDIASWYYPTDKYMVNNTVIPKDIHSVVPAQALGIYVQNTVYGSGQDPNSTDWSLAGQVTVTNFAYQSATVTFNSLQSQYVKLQVMGGSADVAVDDLSVYSWHGTTVPAGAASTDWKGTEAWVVSNATAEATYVQLDHSRANPAIDQAVRSLLLTNGMGVMEFDYRVMRPPAKVTVQYAAQSAPNMWYDISSFVVSNVTSWMHASAYLGVPQPGYFRVLNERSGACTNAWIDINDSTVWDEPYVSNSEWRVYNAKITQTDTNRVLMDLTKACYLNNSPTVEAVPPQTAYEPFLMSPTLPKGLGTLSFYARAYNTNESATVSVYATTNGWNAPTNQWFEICRFEYITNTLYQPYTFAPAGGRSDIQAVKLMTGTSAAARRVCLEEVAVSEPVLPGFDIVNVKLMHNDNDSTYTARAQPLMGEDIAVEARVAHQQLEPSNIVMYVSYYVGTNVWGVGNWPAGQTVTRSMHPVVGDPTLYRTRDDNGGVSGLPAEQMKGILKQDSDAVVQYYVWATYLGGVPLVKRQATFENPAWYYPVDLNQTFSSQGWSPYYIVYGVPLGAVWVNEVNATDYVTDSNWNQVLGIWDHQYIEIAVPVGVDLSGWSVDLVKSADYVTRTITIPAGLPEQTAVTNGYAFFVIGCAAPSWLLGTPALPKMDYEYSDLSSDMPRISPGGLRLRRPLGMYEQAVAYDWNSFYGSSFSGSLWAANDPQGKFVYVGRDENGGSLSKMNVTGDSTNTWVFPKLWTPGWPNDGQTVPFSDVTMQGIQAAATPVFAPISGTEVAHSLDITITSATEGATVRYTLDGSDPSAESAVYSGVITLTQSATVKAKAFKADLLPSFTASAIFSIASADFDIVSVKADLANTTYTESGTNIDFRITLAGRFDLNSVGGTTALLPQIRMIVNGDVAFASLHSVMQYKVADFTVDRTDVLFRYCVKPGDMAQPLRIDGLPTAPYVFIWNGWEVRNSVTTNLAVWKFNRPSSLPSEGEVYDPDLSGANITVRTLSFDENSSPPVVAARQPATWRVTTVNPVVSDVVDFYAWTTGTNIVQVGMASNQTALLVSMPVGATDVDFPIQGLAVGTADIYLQRVKDYQNNGLVGVTNCLKRMIRVQPGLKPYVCLVPSAWEYAETTSNMTGSLTVFLSEAYTNDVWVLLTSSLQGASQSNIVFATTNAIRIVSGSTNSAAVRFSTPDGTLESEKDGIDIVPTVTNSPAKSYFTDLRPTTVYVDNVRPAVTQPVARDISLTPLPQYTNVAMGRPFTFNYSVTDVPADAASMVVRWGFGDGTAAVVMTGAVAHVTHTYASLGTKFVWMQAMDKDGGYSDYIDFPIAVVPPKPPPVVRVLSPPGAWPETHVLNGAALTVQLSEAFTNVVTVGLSITPATNDLNGAITLSTNRVDFAVGETQQTVSISIQDGTDLSSRSGFTITPTVLANPSAVAYFTDLMPGCVTITNVAPVIASPADSGTNVAFTVTRSETCVFNWNISDVAPDSTADPSAGMKVTWTFGDGASEERCGCSGTVTHAYLAVGDMAVRVVASDKDGGQAASQFNVRVEAKQIIFYVDASRPDDSGAGMSWGTAKKTIQAAVNATLDGDTVLVANGVYNTGAAVAQGQALSNRVVITRAITVRSINGAEATVIEGSGTNCYDTAQAVRCVFMANGVLQGFTLQYGATGNGIPGGGVCMFNAAAGSAVSDCVIRGNKASSGGGSCYGTLNNCTLSGNTATSSGGGSYYGTLNNCTLSGNTAASGSGSYYGTLNNSIVWANTTPDGRVNNYESSTFYSSCSEPLPFSGVGNITADPLFAGVQNFRLRFGSPCIDAGDNVFVTLSSDLLGAPRILNDKVDMGAFEGGVQVAATPVLSPTDGTFFSGLRKITISCATESAEIRYTLDGTEPTRQSPLYTKAFNIAQTTTIKAKAFKAGITESSTAVSTYYRQITPLSEAVDATNLVFTAGGSSMWFSQANVTHDAQDAAQSGAVTDNQSTWMETTVTGPGALNFWWKASCEDDPDADNWDFVRFLVDGIERYRLDGITDWRQINSTFGAGAHVLRWEYSKDESLSDGDDRAWVDQLLVVQGIPTATFTTPVPVPYVWLNQYSVLLSLAGGDYESAALLDAAGKGHAAWQEYVAGTDPTNQESVLLTLIAVSNGMRNVAWTPDLGTARVYTVLGRTNLTGGTWGPTNAGSRFFRARVEMP